MIQKQRHYIHWRNSDGKDCKAIGVATKCFCQHWLKEHIYQDPKKKQIPCNVSKCTCKVFFYVPVHGSLDFKCLCKHSYKMHDQTSGKRSCQKCSCLNFGSVWSCSCMLKFDQHQIIVETREERLQQGRFVSEIEGLLQEQQFENFTDLLDESEKFGNDNNIVKV